MAKGHAVSSLWTLAYRCLSVKSVGKVMVECSGFHIETCCLLATMESLRVSSSVKSRAWHSTGLTCPSRPAWLVAFQTSTSLL